MSPTNKSYVSIQLPLGGHTFSSNNLKAVAADKVQDIIAIVDTAKCIVVPREHLDREHAERILQASGIVLGSDEVVVCSPDAPMIAVMVMNSECHAMLQHEYGDRVSFTTPLLNSPMPERGSVIHLSGNTLYVRIADNGLKFVEAIEVAGDADILYMLENINKVYNIYNMYARAEGDTERVLALCKHSFKNIVCE